MGPGVGRPRHQAADLRSRARTPTLRDAYETQARGMINGGVDAVLIETAQDLLQAKAAVVGAQAGAALPPVSTCRSSCRSPSRPPAPCSSARRSVRRSRRSSRSGIDMIGLNCATGPTEMSEHLRHLARHAQIGVSCMPNAGLPGAARLRAPGTRSLPSSWPTPTTRSPASTASGSSAAAAAPRPSTCVRWSSGSAVARWWPADRVVTPARRAVPARAVPAGHLVPLDRRAHERQRVEGVPRGHARAALGRLRPHREGPDQGRRPPARRVRRLRRPRRRRRRPRDRGPVRDGVDDPAGHRLDRATGGRGRARDDRWSRRRQLGQLRGRRRARARVSSR